MKIIYLMLMIITANSFARTELQCSKEGTVVLYVNGQENEKEDAIKALRELKLLSEVEFSPLKLDKYEISFDFSYNRTFGKNRQGVAMADFVESAALLLASGQGVTLEEAWVAAYRTLMGVWHPKDPLDRYLESKTQAMMLLNTPEILNQLYSATAVDLQAIKTKTKGYLGEDKKIIFISHSQGNLFVNVAYNQLVQENAIVNNKPFIDYIDILGNLQIATPSKSIPIENRSWVTNNKDAILSVPLRLDPNFSLSLPYNDPRTDLADRAKNHSMLDTYLSGKTGDVVRGNLPELRSMVFNELEKVAQSLDSNCGEEFTPPIEYSANFGPLSATPVEIDGSDTIKALELRNNSSFLKIEWSLGSNIRNSTEKKITQYFNSGLSYPSTAKIFFENGKSTEVKFDVDLTSYTGGAIPFADLQLLPNEFINTTAMDLGWNHYYLFTTLHRLITLNPDSGQMISEKVIPENVIWMSTNKSGNIVLIYLDIDRKLKFALKNPINGTNSLDVALNGDINMFSDPAFDKKNNILYYSLSVNGGGYVLDPADGIFKILNTLVAVNADTGAELARADYLSGSIQEEVFRSNFAPTFVNSNGWLVRMGAYAYNSMSGGESVFKAFSAAWNPQTLMIDIVYYPDYIDPAHGFVAMDNRKNLAYSFMRIADFNGPTRFTAIDSKTRGIVYSRSPDAVPSLISPQITSKGHMIGLVQFPCTTICSYSIYRLIRSDDILESY